VTDLSPIPADGHVHTEWSSDAPFGSMARTCERAVAIGLPAVAFTDHANFTTILLRGDIMVPEPFDVDGYLAEVRRCRERYPQLRILSGVELGEPHWHPRPVADLLAAGGFDRVIGSVHCRAIDHGRHVDVVDAYDHASTRDVVRDYLADVVALVESSIPFAVLGHIDYPLRYWPNAAGPASPAAFEAEYREVLRLLAGTTRALEVNTKAEVYPEIVRWWYEVGGDAIVFGSDAHAPAALAREFPAAAAMVEACGFQPGREPTDYWRRRAML
jgi:histidinol-phosphatase (PHP family)